MSRMTGYVGVSNFQGDRFAGNKTALQPVLRELARRGLLFVDTVDQTASAITGIAPEMKLPLVVGSHTVDEVASRADIEHRLSVIETIAKNIYHADAVVADKSIRDQLKVWEAAGYGHLPICMAKTQYSFTTDPNVRGAPTGHSIPVREVRLSAGAGFVVAICGEIMTMPGLPRVPSAETIRLNDAGQIEGLF